MLSDLIIINLIMSAGSVIVALINKIDSKKRGDELKGDTAKIKEEVSSENSDQPKMRDEINTINLAMDDLARRFTILSELVTHTMNRHDSEFKRLWAYSARRKNGR